MESPGIELNTNKLKESKCNRNIYARRHGIAVLHCRFEFPVSDCGNRTLRQSKRERLNNVNGGNLSVRRDHSRQNKRSSKLSRAGSFRISRIGTCYARWPAHAVNAVRAHHENSRFRRNRIGGLEVRRNWLGKQILHVFGYQKTCRSEKGGPEPVTFARTFNW